MKIGQIARNLGTLASDPAILRHYIPWVLSRLGVGRANLSVHGSKIGGFPNFSSYLGAARNPLTADEIAFIRKWVSEARIILDVGANFGALAIPMAKMAPHARIFAFEPNPRTAKALEDNLRRNRIENVTIVQAAATDQDGDLFFSDSSDPATDRIVAESDRAVRVEGRSLVSFCRENAIEQVDFLKIDVEGAEMSVLSGAQELFERGDIRAGMIEVCPGNLRNFGRNVSDLLQFFASRNFNLEVLGPNRGAVIDDSLSLENAGFFPSDG